MATKTITLLEKYYPKNWEDLYLPTKVSNLLLDLQQQKGYRLLLFSSPGTGKSTTARIMTLNDDVMYLSGSNDFNIKTLRERVYPFSSRASVKRQPKTIVIDEAENIRDALQDAFKIVFDKCISTNFIFITNEVEKINDAIRSRCTSIEYDFIGDNLEEQRKNYIGFALKVIKNEGIKYDNAGVKALYQLNFPDYRHLLVHLQEIKSSNDTLSAERVKLFFDIGKQDLKLYSLIENPAMIGEEFYMEISRYKGKEKEAFKSLGEPFFEYLNEKKMYDKTLSVAIEVSKYSSMFLSTINKFTTFLSCCIELKSLFK